MKTSSSPEPSPGGGKGNGDDFPSSPLKKVPLEEKFIILQKRSKD
jgi:hypothetical protein